MKKKLLALSVASVVAGQAAALDLTPGNAAGTVIYASEITNTGSITITNSADVTSILGFSIAQGTSKYLRYNFSNVVLGAALTAGSIATAASATESATLSSGGAIGSDFAIFELTDTGTDLATNDDITLSLTQMHIATAAATTVTYTLYETAADSVAETGALYSASGSIYSFAQALTFTKVATTPNEIDVTADSQQFTNGLTNDQGSYTIGLDVGGLGIVDTAGAAVTYGGIVNTTTSTVEVAGDYSAVQDLTGGVPDGTFTAGNVVAVNGANVACGAGTAASALTASLATLGAPAAASITVCQTVNGVSVIPEQTFSATYKPVATSAAWTVSDVDATLSTHQKNGDSADINLSLTPTNLTDPGVYSNYVRISNKTGIAGDVSMLVYNDDGDVVALDLADIAGFSTSLLDAQASTPIINVNDIFAAAQAADPTFDVVGDSRKLRIIVSGEFADVDAQNISVSTDGSTFFTFGSM